MGENTIVSSTPQVPPRGCGASHRVKIVPPPTETFFNLPAAKKPIQRPSGEKKSLREPSLHAIGHDSIQYSDLK
jgi:hypothetical protein